MQSDPLKTPLIKHYSAAFLLDFGTMLGFTALPFFVFNVLDGDERMSGFIAGSLSLTYAVMCVFGARFVQRLANPLEAAACGAVVFGVSMGAACLMRVPVLFALCAIVAYIGLATAWPVLHAWLGAVMDPTKRARWMAWFNIAWSAGLTLGSLMAGPLFDVVYWLPYAVLFVAGLMAAALLITQPDEKRLFIDAAPPESIATSAEYARRSAGYLPATWLASVTGLSLLGACRAVYPKRLDDLVAADALYLLPGMPDTALPYPAASMYSLLAFGLTFTSVVVYDIMGRTGGWHYRHRYLVFLQVISAAAFWVLANTNSLLVMYLAYTATGATAYVAFFMGVYYSISDPALKLRRTAFNESLVGMGGFAGAVAYGWAASKWGIGPVFAWTPVWLGVSVLAQGALLRVYSTQSR